MGGLPVGGRGAGIAGGGVVKEAVSKVANATKGVDNEGEKLDVLGVERGDDVEVGGIRRIATKFCLCFLVVPVVGGIRSVFRQIH